MPDGHVPDTQAPIWALGCQPPATEAHNMGVDRTHFVSYICALVSGGR